MTPAFLLTAAAEEDLRGIIRYTRTEFGEAQARRYAAKLNQGIERMVSGDGRFTAMTEVHPGLRMARCERHYAFCLIREAEPALVIAILHERMDLMVRLAGRLG